MKRVKSNYHALHVLKTADPKLCKAIISNCNKELVNSISECILNVLNGNVKLAGCNTRKLRKHSHTSQGRRQTSSSSYQEEANNSTRRVPAPTAQRRSASDREPDGFV